MTQAAEHWDTFARELFQDGSLRDIYVLGTGLEDWASAARFIVDQGYKIEFAGKWEGESFPSDIGRLFPTGPESRTTTLSIDLSGVLVNCHFFSHDEIEFDLNPGDVSDSSKLNEVFLFMQGLADALGKDVLLTPENVREIPIFRSRPQAALIEHTPFGGFT